MNYRAKEHLTYDSVGTAAAPATLTAAYTGNRQTHLSKFMPNLHIDFTYTPKAGQTNRFASILVEVSNDDGTTWKPFTIRQNITTTSLVYVDDADGNNGINLKIPGDGTSTGGTALSGSIDTNVIADKVRVSVKEDGSANFGTMHIQTTVSSSL